MSHSGSVYNQLYSNHQCSCYKNVNNEWSTKPDTQYHGVQALYAKAAEIVWKHDKFKNIIIRMGLFHTIHNLLSIIGKWFQYAGLRDLLRRIWCHCRRVCCSCNGWPQRQPCNKTTQACIWGTDEACLERFPSLAQVKAWWRGSPLQQSNEEHCQLSGWSFSSSITGASWVWILYQHLAAVWNLPALHQKSAWPFSNLDVISWLGRDYVGVASNLRRG